ncbi:hypothetical protein BVC80_1835g436 [Macleaya cordata]|uniref:Uncharacterized protein n=1 Tax=Macleaya cordata TaxID=56857 RepID=A0A200R5P6_MACCD|nr:hypothetical protein BVC80_1835g436 [Macleaya cordata]
MSPVAMCIEELIPSNNMKSNMYSILIRTGLVFSTLLVGLTIPFFGVCNSSIPYLNQIPIRPDQYLEWSGDGTDRIFTDNACYFDSPMCLLSKHLKE